MTSDKHLKVGLVGAGAMGRALAVGLVRSRPEVAASMSIYDPVTAAVDAAVADIGARSGRLAEVAESDLVCVAVKPDDMSEALTELRPELASTTVVLSVAAGWDLDRLEQHLPNRPVVRAMPNLAVRYGAGVFAFATRNLAHGDDERLRRTFAPLGVVVELKEALFPVATALAGSGPGLIALIAEALEDGAVGCGLGRQQAREMVGAVIAGSGALLADGTDPSTLRQQVSSPAGTTIAGLSVLERGAVRAHVADALAAAARRASEL